MWGEPSRPRRPAGAHGAEAEVGNQGAPQQQLTCGSAGLDLWEGIRGAGSWVGRPPAMGGAGSGEGGVGRGSGGMAEG